MPAKKPLNTQPTNRLLDVSTLANSPYEKIFNPQSENIPIQQSNVFNKTPTVPQRQIQRAPSAMSNQNVILSAGMQILPEEQMPEEPSDDSSNFLGSLIAQGIAGIGTGLMGGDSYDIMRSANVFQNMRDRQANEKRAKLLTDPKSEESKRRRLVFEKALNFKIPEEYSYTDLNDPVVLQSIRDKNMQAIASKGGIGGARGGGVGQVKEEKKKKLGVEEAKTLFNISTAYNAVQDLKNAVNKNVNRYSIYGDNEYTESANRFKQGIGRLLSGGAIGDKETEDFLNLIPTSRDSDETAKRKLEKMDQDLTFKYKTLGYNKEDVLYPNNDTPIIDITPSEQDEAIQWANKNINSKDEATRIKAERILRGQ
jgi:hypothetical protein